MKYLRISIGLAAWLVGGAMLFVWARASFFGPDDDGGRVAELWQYATAEHRLVRLQLQQPWPLAVGDPIYRIEGPNSIQQVGEIRRRIPADQVRQSSPNRGPVYEALLYPAAPPLTRDSFLQYHVTPRSMAWVIETMLPPSKRAQIAREIVTTFEAHHRKILEALKPIVIAGLRDALRVAEDDLTEAIARRQDELEQLGNRYQDAVLQKEIAPLVRDEIWPVVQQHAEPLANEIGQQLFARASLWRFGWRLLYDKSFLPEKNLTQDEWERFVQEEGIPVLNSYRDQIVTTQREMIEEIANNHEVRNVVRDQVRRVLDDQQFRAIVWDIFRDVLVDNPRLRETLEQRWRTEEARQAMQLAAEYVEPCVRRIGDLLIGTRSEGIAPEFAQVLRNQILDKDSRWLVIKTPGEGPAASEAAEDVLLPVRHGGYPEVSPFAEQLQGDMP